MLFTQNVFVCELFGLKIKYSQIPIQKITKFHMLTAVLFTTYVLLYTICKIKTKVNVEVEDRKLL